MLCGSAYFRINHFKKSQKFPSVALKNGYFQLKPFGIFSDVLKIDASENRHIHITYDLNIHFFVIINKMYI